MSLETPVWLQTETYSARADRTAFDAMWADEGVVDSGLAVSQRGAGANNSVDVAVGIGVVQGDDQADQGKYVVRNTAVVNVPVTAAPGSNSRIDLVVLQIRDSNAGGDPGDDAIFDIIEGVAAGSPVAPAVPDSALLLARILRTAGDTSVTTAMITDQRTLISDAGTVSAALAAHLADTVDAHDASAVSYVDPGVRGIDDVQEAINALYHPASSAQTADYTLAAGDDAKVVELNAATGKTVTIPANATTPFAVGTIIEIYQQGAGQVTVAAAGGVTLRAPGGAKTRTQYSTIVVRKRDTNEWVVSGDTTS